MSKKRYQYIFPQNQKSNFDWRTKPKKSYLKEQSQKYNNTQRYKSSYHFSLRSLLKQNHRNIIYLRQILNKDLENKKQQNQFKSDCYLAQQAQQAQQFQTQSQCYKASQIKQEQKIDINEIS